MLDIQVKGFGNKIKSITMDGKPLENVFLPATVAGKHEIKIVMMDNEFGPNPVNEVPNKFSLPNPLVRLGGSTQTWEVIPEAVSYSVYKNEVIIKTVDTNFFEVSGEGFAEYKVTANDDDGFESFSSEPILVYPKSAEQILEMENYAPKSSLPYTNYSGKKVLWKLR